MRHAAFDVTSMFEYQLAEYSGARHAVAVASGTWAIFLSLKWFFLKSGVVAPRVEMPRRTFISVPFAVIHAGGDPVLVDCEWKGVYTLDPWPIVDGALRFRRGMYQKDHLHCLSFHARKIFNIGNGGAILTDDRDAYEWLKAARYSGRKGPLFRVEDIEFVGWQCYMQPERAARGLHLLEYVKDDNLDQKMKYPDLAECKVLQKWLEHRRDDFRTNTTIEG